jgi:chaperone modulatory protein CbpM
MNPTVTEVYWLDEHPWLSLVELAELSGLSAAELQGLADFGAIVAVDLAAEPLQFRADCLPLTRAAGRLRQDFELDIAGLAVALALLDRVHELETQVRRLNARMPILIGPA